MTDPFTGTTQAGSSRHRRAVTYARHTRGARPAASAQRTRPAGPRAGVVLYLAPGLRLRPAPLQALSRGELRGAAVRRQEAHKLGAAAVAAVAPIARAAGLLRRVAGTRLAEEGGDLGGRDGGAALGQVGHQLCGGARKRKRESVLMRLGCCGLHAPKKYHKLYDAIHTSTVQPPQNP